MHRYEVKRTPILFRGLLQFFLYRHTLQQLMCKCKLRNFFSFREMEVVNFYYISEFSTR